MDYQGKELILLVRRIGFPSLVLYLYFISKYKYNYTR